MGAPAQPVRWAQPSLVVSCATCKRQIGAGPPTITGNVTILYDTQMAHVPLPGLGPPVFLPPLQLRDACLRAQHDCDRGFPVAGAGMQGLAPHVPGSALVQPDTISSVVKRFIDCPPPPGVGGAPTNARPGCAILLTDFECSEDLLTVLTATLQEIYHECRTGGHQAFYNAAGHIRLLNSFPGVPLPIPGAAFMPLTAAFAHSWIYERFVVIRTCDLLAYVSPSSIGNVSTVARLAFLASSETLQLLRDGYPGLDTIDLILASVAEVRALNWVGLNGGNATAPVVAMNAQNAVLNASRRAFNTTQVMACDPWPPPPPPPAVVAGVVPIPRSRALNYHGAIQDAANALPTHEILATQTTEANSRYLAVYRAMVAIHLICILALGLEGGLLKAKSLVDVPSHVTSGNTVANDLLQKEFQTVVKTASESGSDEHIQYGFSVISDSLTTWGTLIMSAVQATWEKQQGFLPNCEFGVLIRDVIRICVAVSQSCIDGRNVVPVLGLNAVDDITLIGRGFLRGVAAISVTGGVNTPVRAANLARMQDPAMVLFFASLQVVLLDLVHTARHMRQVPPGGLLHTTDLLPSGDVALPHVNEELLDTLKVSADECLKRRFQCCLLPFLLRDNDVASHVARSLVNTVALGDQPAVTRYCNANGHALTNTPSFDYREQHAINDTLSLGSLLSGTIRTESNATVALRRIVPCFSQVHQVTLLNGTVCRLCVSVNTIRGDVVADSPNFIVAANFTNVFHVVLTSCEDGRLQYLEDLHSLHPDLRPPPHRIRHTHVGPLGLAIMNGGQMRNGIQGPQAWQLVARLGDIVFGSGFSAVVLAQWIRDPHLLAAASPIGVNLRVTAFTLGPSAPVFGVPMHQETRILDDIHNYELWCEDDLTYTASYSTLLAQSFDAITQRPPHLIHRAPGDNSRVRPGAFVMVAPQVPGPGGVIAPAVFNAATMVLFLSVDNFIREIINMDDVNGWSPLSVGFMRDLAHVRPADAHRDNPWYDGARGVGIEPSPAQIVGGLGHCTPMHFLFGTNAGSVNFDGAQPLFDSGVLFDPANYGTAAGILRMGSLKDRMLHVAAFGYLSPESLALPVDDPGIFFGAGGNGGLPRPHLRRLLHRDIGTRITSLGEVLGLFDAIDFPRVAPPPHPPLVPGGLWPPGPGVPVRLNRLLSSLGFDNPLMVRPAPPPGDVVCVTCGPSSSEHDSLKQNTAHQYVLMDTLVQLTLLSFASSTDQDPKPLCVFIPPDKGKQLPGLEALKSSLRTRLISLLMPVQPLANLLPPLLLVAPGPGAAVAPAAPLAHVESFVDHLLQHISLTDSPEGVIENGNEEMYVVNVILSVGGVASTEAGMQMLRKVRRAKDCMSAGFGGYPSVNSRRENRGFVNGHQTQSPLTFRTLFFSVRGTFQGLRLTGVYYFSFSFICHSFTHCVHKGVPLQAMQTMQVQDGNIHAIGHGNRLPLWTLRDRLTGGLPYPVFVLPQPHGHYRNFFAYSGVDERDRFTPLFDRPNLGSVSHFSNPHDSDRILRAVKTLACYRDPQGTYVCTVSTEITLIFVFFVVQVLAHTCYFT